MPYLIDEPGRVTEVDNPFYTYPEKDNSILDVPQSTLKPVTPPVVKPLPTPVPEPTAPEKDPNKFDSHTMENISGSEVQVMFEFPTNDVQKSVYIHMSDLITVSHSVARAKIPVYLLGDTIVSGLALGTKMVAGSIVKLYTRNDALTNHIKQFVDKRFEDMKKSNISNLSDIQSNISMREISDFMRDDLSPFNIHLITTSENDNTDTEAFGVDSIMGATLINTGNVFSIENLISEETISFLAKEVRYQTDISKGKSTFFDPQGIPSGSSLLSGL